MEIKNNKIMSIEQEKVMKSLVSNGVNLQSSKMFTLNASPKNIKLINDEYKSLSNMYLKSDDINFETTNEYKQKESIILNNVKSYS